MQRTCLVRIALLNCLILFGASFCGAEDIRKIHPTGYVTDLASVIGPDAKARLEALCAELEQKTGAQMAIVTVTSLEGESVDVYAVDLFKQLGVGGKKDNRGLLLLVAPNERKYRIEVGYGLEPVINDARAGDAGRAMVPYLRQGNYRRATEVAARQLVQYIADDSGVTLSTQPPAVRSRPHPDDDQISGLGLVAGLIIFIGIIGLLISLAARGGGSGCLWFLLGMFLNSGGGRSSGGWGGGSWGGGGSSGGFGGFGGGSSGGGGASGSW
ncbi:MAG TPA: TPM domain-containing protein [Candidatus Acidoferrum sp.]|nr:TPM domain-containing protein [Candidatus Acidoferrum sp.]